MEPSPFEDPLGLVGPDARPAERDDLLALGEFPVPAPEFLDGDVHDPGVAEWLPLHLPMGPHVQEDEVPFAS